jgi:UPF0755 protein
LQYDVDVMQRLLKALALLTCLALITLGAAIYYGWQAYTAPGPLQQAKIVDIPKGAGLGAITDKLIEQAIITRPYLFRVAARLRGIHTELRAGEYQFSAGATIRDVLNKLHAGDSYLRSITIPEGWTSYQVVRRLRKTDTLQGEIDKIPNEGSLLPETYHYAAGTKRDTLIRRMQAKMDKFMTQIWPQRAENLPLKNKRQAITLASLVEKETGKSGERDKVAGVFINRLRRGMRLQSDPSVIYAMTNGKPEMQGKGPIGRRLLNKDLKIDSPYNTYKHAELPPGPIANPGRKAIQAVLTPAEHNYLYFVADGDGGHAFARSLEAHNANVRKWREIRAQRGE